MLLSSLSFALYETIYNYDYPGNDIGDMMPIDINACYQACEDTSGCIGYVHFSGPQSTAPECWLKSGISNGLFKAGSFEGGLTIFRFKLPEGTVPALNTYMNFDHSGDDLEHLPETAYADCYDLCVAKNTETKTCFAYVFDLPAGKGCWLKASFDVFNIPEQPNNDRQLNVLDPYQ